MGQERGRNLPSPLAWSIVAEHGGDWSPTMHVGMATGIVRAVTEPWATREVGYSREPGRGYVRTAIVVLRLTDVDAGRLLTGALRVRSRFAPSVGWETVPPRAIEPMSAAVLEEVPASLRRKDARIDGQIAGLLARVSAGLEQRRRKPA